MNNYQIFVSYGTKMVELSDKTAAVGIQDSGLTKGQIKTGVRQILRNLNRKETDFKQIKIVPGVAVVFEHR